MQPEREIQLAAMPPSLQAAASACRSVVRLYGDQSLYALMLRDAWEGVAANPTAGPTHSDILAEVRRLHEWMEAVAPSVPLAVHGGNNAPQTRGHSSKSPSKGRRLFPPSEEFFSVSCLVARWRCSRTEVNRIINKPENKIRRTLLGSGKKGMVRIRREDVLAYERSCDTWPGGPPLAEA